MKMIVIGEGPIDDILIPPIIGTLANECRVMWPVEFERDISSRVRRGTGFGAVKSAVRKLIAMLNENPELFRKITDHVIIILDGKTEEAQREINEMIQPYDSFFLTIAIEEIEAWVLSDRNHVIEWLGINQKNAPETLFWDRKYRAENDPDPKATLNYLVRNSRLPFEFWDTGAANDYIEKYWRGNYIANHFEPWNGWDGKADIDMMKAQSPNSFTPFSSYLESIFIGIR